MGLTVLIFCLLNVLLDFHYFVRAVILFMYCGIKVRLGFGTRDAFKPVVQ